MAAKTTTNAIDDLSAMGRMIGQAGRFYGGVVVSDTKAALVGESGSRQKADGELCRTCQKLDFVKLLNKMRPAKDTEDVREFLGTYDDIVTRSYCPFCRLVVSAVNNSLRKPINPGYRTTEGEVICCLLRRRGVSRRFLWQRNLKIEIRSMPAKSFFSQTTLHWKLGMEDDMRTDNDFVKGVVQDFDAQIIVHKDSVEKYPFPQPLGENDKNNYSTEGDSMLNLKASSKAGWWLDPIPLLGCSPEPTFNVQKLLDWHKSCVDCSKFDLTAYDAPSQVQVPGMLLIDTGTMTLVRAPAGVAYAALSYVWGKLKSPFRATKANRDELMAERGLIGANLPRTIKEAIEVARNIGFRYFWVDSICIIQDDLEVLMMQIKTMDIIYEGASITIVAAAGNSADDALNTPNHQIHAEMFGDLKIMAKNRPLEAALSRTTWNSRAWCYQEKILSRRMLVFTESEIFYDCSHFRWAESMETPDPQRELSASLKRFVNQGTNDKSIQRGEKEAEFSNPWPNWRLMKSTLEEYSLRALTNENDVVSAIWGVFKSISPAMLNMVGGSPIPYLIYMMLWQPIGPTQRRSTTEVPYPSWSWIGWIGSRKFPELYDTRMPAYIWPMIRDFATSRSTVITSWYFRDSQSGQTPKCLQDIIQLDHRHPNEMKAYTTPLEMIGQEKVIAKTRKLTAEQCAKLEAAEVVLLREGSSYVYALKSECAPYHKEVDVRSLFENHEMPDNGLLQFWTESAFFKVKEFQTKDSERDGDTSSYIQYKIADTKDHWIGTVYLLCEWPTNDNKYEFIILSANIEKSTLEEEGSLHEMPKLRRVKAQLRLMGDPTYVAVYFYDVLMIEWRLGIAYRVGLGSIYFEDWDLAGPVEKLVTL
ncbi:heterokaryon incompatibility protein-domain-containing protein, partial [Tricladium varicosporioides]